MKRLHLVVVATAVGAIAFGVASHAFAQQQPAPPSWSQLPASSAAPAPSPTTAPAPAPAPTPDPAPAPAPAEGDRRPLRFEPTPEPTGAVPVVGSATAPVESKIRTDEEKEERAAKKYHAYFRGGAGFQYARAEEIPILGARMRAGIGFANQKMAHYAMISFLYGSTENSLRTYDIRISWMFDFLRTGIFRMGMDVEIGHLFIRRASADGRLWASGLGAGIHGSFDVIPLDPKGDSAVIIEPRLEGHLHWGDVFMWGPSILVGVRY